MAAVPVPVVLARAQFAFTMAFHIVFPSISIGLASYLAVLEGLWLARGRSAYLILYRYWLKVFALVFGMGVVSGVVMAYQFGSNWSGFADRAGPIVGPLMAYEVLTAFFLEAGFLGVMLFGLERVGRRLHFIATLAVAAGTLLSAFWILSANSWMQTPAGFAMNAVGQFVPVSWLHIIFNPSFPYRFVHMVLAAYLCTALVVGGTAAYQLLQGRAHEEVRRMFSMAMWMALLVAPLQIVAGDQQGLNTLKYQPVKIMGIEGHYRSYRHGAPLVLFGIPDQAAGRMQAAVDVPKLGSLILEHSWNAPMAGLNTVPRRDWPPVPVIFWSFRVMVAIGFGLLALGVAAGIARARRKLYQLRALQWGALLMSPAPVVAIIAGWVTTEVGRQPFVVYGLMRTSAAASPIATPAVATSLAMFVLLYAGVFGSGLWYLLRLLRQPPQAGESARLEGPHRSGGMAAASATLTGHPRSHA